MNHTISALVERLPRVRRLRDQVRTLQDQVARQGLYPAGHFHSPVPDARDVLACFDAGAAPSDEIPGIDLNREGQVRLLREFQPSYEEMPFPEERRQGFRYHFRNDWFSYPDAILLYCFLRKHRPHRIIEVGSGFSSAVMLDTVDRFFDDRPEITLIEPNPERLNDLLTADDRGRVRILERRVQDVPPEVFLSLQAGDLLFVDSSHVTKCGSDVNFLMFHVLPRLPAGVFVHFHDIFYPFEYPPHWLAQGRYWNEIYLLRAFLSFNREWEVYFFNSYVEQVLREAVEETMPLFLRNPGGSLYLRRRRA